MDIGAACLSGGIFPYFKTEIIMIKYFFFFLLMSQYRSSAQSKEWFFIGDKSEYNYIVKDQMEYQGFMSIPFDTTYILPSSLFDSIIQLSYSYDKQYIVYTEKTQFKPAPLLKKYNEKVIVYRNKTVVFFKKKNIL